MTLKGEVVRRWLRASIALLLIALGGVTRYAEASQPRGAGRRSAVRTVWSWTVSSNQAACTEGSRCDGLRSLGKVRYRIPARCEAAGSIRPAPAGQNHAAEGDSESEYISYHPSRALTTSLEFVATKPGTGAAGESGGVGFREDTSHIFRDATGQPAEDTAANRTLIQGAVNPSNLRSTIRLPDGTTLSKYFKTLPDGFSGLGRSSEWNNNYQWRP